MTLDYEKLQIVEEKRNIKKIYIYLTSKYLI